MEQNKEKTVISTYTPTPEEIAAKNHEIDGQIHATAATSEENMSPEPLTEERGEEILRAIGLRTDPMFADMNPRGISEVNHARLLAKDYINGLTAESTDLLCQEA